VGSLENDCASYRHCACTRRCTKLRLNAKNGLIAGESTKKKANANATASLRFSIYSGIEISRKLPILYQKA